jgi:hypothetical protein
LVGYKLNTIAHRHRRCATYAFKPETALYLTVDNLPIVGFHRVPTARILYYQSLHVVPLARY